MNYICLMLTGKNALVTVLRVVSGAENRRRSLHARGATWGLSGTPHRTCWRAVLKGGIGCETRLFVAAL